MVQFARDLTLSTPGEVTILDVTTDVARVVKESGVRLGQALVFTTSSTSAVTVTEFEPGLLEDIPAALERLFPRGLDYGHERRWHDSAESPDSASLGLMPSPATATATSGRRS